MEVFVPAPSAGAPETTAPSPSPSEGTPVSDLLTQIQQAGNAAAGSDNPETPYTGSKPAAEPTPEPVPSVEGRPEQPPEKAADTTEPPPAEQKTPEEAAESIRQLIKKSNLPPEQKAELADLAYQAKALRESGFSFEQAKVLKQMGVTPDVVVERIKLHATVEDAKRDAALAADMREFIADYTSSPLTAAQKLARTNPESFHQFAAEIIRNSGQINPELYVEQQSEGFRTALGRLLNDSVQEGDEETVQSVNRILEKVYGPEGAQAPGQPRQLNPNDPLHRELQQLKERLAREEANKRQSESALRARFEADLKTKGAETIQGEIRNLVLAQKPTGMSPDLVDDVVKHTFDGVVQSLLTNKTYMSEMGYIAAGPLTNEQFDRAMKYTAANCRSLAPIYLKAAFEKFGKYAHAEQQTRQNVLEKAAKPDVGKVAGPPTPASGVPVEQQILAEARAKGWSPLQIIQANARARGA